MNNRKKLAVYRSATAVLAVFLILSLILCAFLLAKTRKPLPAISSDVSSELTSLESTEITEELTEAESTVPETTVDEQSRRIEELEALVDKYAQSASAGFGFQAELYSDLLAIVTDEDRPLRSHVDDEGEPTGEKTPANVAFCYTDLTTGYTFSYNGDEIMYSASLIKLPYVYAVLSEVEKFEYNKRNFDSEGNPLYDENGEPLFEGTHPNLDADGNIIYLEGEEKYDLSREWVYYSSSMFEEGSGEIQHEKDGFTLTYLDLICYAVKYSDNIAFKALRSTFGLDTHNAMLESLDIAGREKGFMQLSAKDCAKYLTLVYEYCESDSPYAKALKEALLTATYTPMIPDALSPIVCGHKYGWDVGAYHDMAIAYDKRPFSLVIMTDLDSGNYKDYMYIQSIAKVILELHQGYNTAEA